MWMRIGGTEADYVTFIPPNSSPSSNHYLDDSEQGDTDDDSFGYSGYGELDRGGSGHHFHQLPPQPLQARQRRNGMRMLPNPNHEKDILQETSQNFQCTMEGEDDLDENSSPVALDLHPYEWDRVHKFSKKVGWKMIFALNVQIRGFMDWDMSNALDLIKYSMQHGHRTAWELGNGEKL